MTELTSTVSVQQKVNIGRYESADLFMSVHGVGVNTTPDEMDEIIAQSKVVYSKLAREMKMKVAAIRNTNGHDEEEE